MTTVIRRPVSDGRLARVDIVDHEAVAFVGEQQVGSQRPQKLAQHLHANGTTYTHVIGKLAITTDEAEMIIAALPAPKPQSRRRFSLGHDDRYDECNTRGAM